MKKDKKLHRKVPVAPSAGGLFWLGSGMRFLQNVQPSFSGTGRRRHPMQSKTGIRPSFSCYWSLQLMNVIRHCCFVRDREESRQAPMALLQVSVLNTAAEKSFVPSAFQVGVAEVTPVCPLAGFAWGRVLMVRPKGRKIRGGGDSPEKNKHRRAHIVKLLRCLPQLGWWEVVQKTFSLSSIKVVVCRSPSRIGKLRFPIVNVLFTFSSTVCSE